jgi:hypothetical protein
MGQKRRGYFSQRCCADNLKQTRNRFTGRQPMKTTTRADAITVIRFQRRWMMYGRVQRGRNNSRVWSIAEVAMG